MKGSIHPYPAGLVSEPGPRYPRRYCWYHGRQSVLLGTVQVLCGLVSILFQVVGYLSELSTPTGAYFFLVYFTGLWCGFVFIISGGVGIAAGRLKTKSLIKAYLIITLVTVVFFDWYLMCWFGTAIAVATNDCGALWGYRYHNGCIQNDLVVASLALCVGAGAVHFLAGGWAIVITAMALCTRPKCHRVI